MNIRSDAQIDKEILRTIEHYQRLAICNYQSAGYIYPDYQNCTADIAAQKLPSSYECLPVDAVVRAKDDL